MAIDPAVAAFNAAVATVTEIVARYNKKLITVRVGDVKTLRAALDVMTAPTTKSWHVTLTPTGAINTAYPLGNPPVVYVVTIASIPNVTTITAGANYSENFASYVSGADSGLASLSVEAITGTLAGVDLAFATSTLSGATPDVGTVSLQLVAKITGAEVARSNTFVRTVISAAPPDTLAPTKVAAPSVSVVSSTALDVSFDVAMDGQSATILATGMAAAQVQQRLAAGPGAAGNAGAAFTLTAGEKLTWTTGSIGSPVGTNTCTQSNADFNFSVAGGTLGQTAGAPDRCALAYVQETGDFELSAYIPEWTGIALFDEALLMIRQSLATTDKMVALHRFRAAIGVAASTRNALGAARVPSSYATDLSGYFKVARNSATHVWTFSYQTTSGAWVDLHTQTVVMTDPVYVCVAADRNTDTTVIAPIIQQVTVNKQARKTLSVTSLLPATGYQYRVSFTDLATPAANSTLTDWSAIATTQAAAGVYKWHPGIYLSSDTQPVTPGTLASIFSEMDTMAAITGSGGQKMKGFRVNFTWYWLETSQGVYNFSLIDQCITHLNTLSTTYGVQFYLIIQVNDASPGAVSTQNEFQVAPNYSGSSTYRGTLPSYIFAAGPLNGASGTGGAVFTDAYNVGSQTYYHPALWRAALMDRFIALQTALGAAYDGNARVEMIIPVGETSWALQFPPTDLNDSNWVTQIKRLIDTTASSWPTTNKIFNTTWNPTQVSTSALKTVSDYQYTKKCGSGGPDILDPVYMGYSVDGAEMFRGTGGAFGTTDRSGVVASAWCEQANWSNWPPMTAARVEAYGYTFLRQTHAIYNNHGTYGGAGYNLSDVIAALNANAWRVHSTLPSSYV